VFAFSLRKPCKEGKGNKKDGLFPFAFFLKKKKKILSLYCKFEKLYSNKTLHAWNAFLRSFEQLNEYPQTLFSLFHPFSLN
jgi:hypothetical protein